MNSSKPTGRLWCCCKFISFSQTQHLLQGQKCLIFLSGTDPISQTGAHATMKTQAKNNWSKAPCLLNHTIQYFFATMIQVLSCSIKDFRKLKQSCFSASFPNVWLQFLIRAIANQTHEDLLVRRKTDICVWLFATDLNAAAIFHLGNNTQPCRTIRW